MKDLGSKCFCLRREASTSAKATVDKSVDKSADRSAFGAAKAKGKP